MTCRLNNRVAIVTGSSRGIGRSIAIMFAREGAKVCVNYVGSEDKARAVVNEIVANGGEAIMVRADVSKPDEVKHLVETTVNTFGTIDILVNNAAVMYPGSIMDLRDEELDRMWKVNVKGVIHCCREVAKYMIEKKYGKIINITSTAAIGTASHSTTLYALTKAAVIILTRRLAFELGPYGINVNAIAPSFVPTDMFLQGRTKEELEAILEKRKETVSLRKIATPDDIARVAVFLASDESSYITGQVIVVDGGRIDYLTHSL
ncbi:MAG: glucose 1-dehydrogenase [Thaumarchaeota archaeon]|nr:glucose 1-dehydrogenase [Candidatus Wolframiiraptor allenii]